MLLDTSGLLCLHHKAEPFHDQARASYNQARIRLTHSSCSRNSWLWRRPGISRTGLH